MNFKQFVILAAVFFALGLSSVGVNLFISNTPEAPPQMNEATAGVESKPAVFARGIVEGNTPPIEIKSTVNYQIKEIFVKEGDFVTTGQRLALLDNSIPQSEIRVAASEIEKAQAKLDLLNSPPKVEDVERLESDILGADAEQKYAQIQLNRTKELIKRNSTSPQELENAQYKYDIAVQRVKSLQAALRLLKSKPKQEDIELAEKELASAQARLNTAKVQDGLCSVLAPSNGKILRINATAGELPMLDPILIMCDDTQGFFIRAEVQDFDSARVAVGNSVRIIPDGDGVIHTGKIVEASDMLTKGSIVDPRPDRRVDTTFRKIRVKVDGDSTGLIVGLPVDIEIRGN